MKIVFLLPGLPARVGGFKVCYMLANQLSDHGNEVLINHSALIWPHIKKRNKMSLTLIFLYNFLRVKLFLKDLSWVNLNKNIIFKYNITLNRSFFKKNNYDYLVVTSWGTATEINKLNLSKKKIIYLIQDFPPFMGSESDIYETWKYGFKNIVVSEYLKSMVEKVSNVKPSLVNPGIDHEKFYSFKNILSRDPFKIGFFFSKGSYKDYQTAYNVFYKLTKIDSRFKIIMYGKDKPSKLHNQIKWIGKITEKELLEFYNDISIFVSTSIMEGFCAPILEAMACGSVPVCTDNFGNRDYIRNEKNCLLVEKKNEDQLVEKILKLVKDQHLIKFLSENAIKTSKNFNWVKSYQNFQNVIKNDCL